MLAWTIRNEGVAALMKGLVPRLWYAVPGSAITFVGESCVCMCAVCVCACACVCVLCVCVCVCCACVCVHLSHMLTLSVPVCLSLSSSGYEWAKSVARLDQP